MPTSPLTALPARSDIQAYNTAREARIRAQQERQRVIEAEKTKQGRAKFNAGGEAARAKREARAKAKADKERAKRIAEGEAVENVEETARPAASQKEELTATAAILPEAESSSTDTQPAGTQTLDPIQGTHFHSIPATPFFPPSSPPSASTSITAIPHPLFPFTSTVRDNALVSVFTHLHARGLRVGLGPRFGGEYLIYPGDYLRYHAHFTSQVIVDDEPIKPGEIVAWGRLGTGTKKAGLLCCWSPPEKCAPRQEVGGTGDAERAEYEPVEADMGEVEFYSLEWASFG